MSTRKPDESTEDATLKLPDRPGFARALGERLGGRTREFREGERARGDTGGGEREDGMPDVPHGTDEHAASDES